MALALNNLKRVDMPLNKETEEFKSWTKLSAFPYMLMPLEKGMNLFFLPTIYK